MYRLFAVLSLFAAAPVLAQPTLPAAVHVYEAYAEQPLVAAVRAQGYLALLDREKLLDKRFPTDRAWAVVDAVGADGVARHAVDAFVAQGLLARLAIGASGALRPRDINVDELDARQAFVLGWLRALAAGNDTRRLLRRSDLVTDAGPLQLLELAAHKAPGVQAIRAAYAIVRAVADADPKNACQHAVVLARLARDGGTESLRLSAAERVDALAHELGAACHNREMAELRAPIQLPPPLPEQTVHMRPGTVQAAGPTSTPFFVVAPFFKGWLTDPLIAGLMGGGTLDAQLLTEAMKRDKTGDLAIVALNATVLLGRQNPTMTAEVTWEAIATKHGAKADLDATVLPLAQLTPQEATVYAYAQALMPQPLSGGEDPADARLLRAATLFAAAKGKLPSAATLGPLMALGHNVDLGSLGGPCSVAEQEDALRGVALRATLPEAGRQPLIQALDMLLRQCQTKRPQRASP
jgi:hypothetical protein